MSIYKIYWIHRSMHADALTEGYIGVTKDLEKRIDYHTKSNYLVGKAMRKYDDIKIEVLNADLTIEEAFALELKYRPTEKIGWNIAKGGNGGVGHIIPNDETRKKMSISRKKYLETAINPTTTNMKFQRSDEAKENIKMAVRDSYAKGRVNNRKGVTLSDSQKAKQRAAANNRPVDRECKCCGRMFTAQGIVTHLKHKEQCRLFVTALNT